tara:strand:+ start:176 stop:439 length:264 start_codon:yes stop_codon:yes gene_type:complete
MLKEIKYIFYILIIFFFTFFCFRYYFSDENFKNSFRVMSKIDDKIKNNEKNLIILKSDTENIVQYLDGNINENEENYKFWELLQNNK